MVIVNVPVPTISIIDRFRRTKPLLPPPLPPPTRQSLIIDDRNKINSNRSESINLDTTRMSYKLMPFHKSKLVETISGSPIFVKIEKHAPPKVISPQRKALEQIIYNFKGLRKNAQKTTTGGFFTSPERSPKRPLTI